MEPVDEFTVELETWHRGKDGASLLDRDGMQCCLGFWVAACGVSPEDMIGVPMPSGVPRSGPTLADRLHRAVDDNVWGAGTAIAEQNDDPDIDDHARMRELRYMFARRGITVHFTLRGKEIDLD